MNRQLPEPGGLYRREDERDACGVGFVATISGQPTHAILSQALGALGNLAHRGAVAADGLSGDGAGILTQIPHGFFRRSLSNRDIELESIEDLAVGVFFLPQDEKGFQQSLELVESTVLEGGLRMLCWRSVPVDEDTLGERARRAVPEIRHLLVARAPGDDDETFERRLYLVRRRIERRAWAQKLDLYVPSFSHRTLVYKGLMVGHQLDRFYPDLADPNYLTAIALFHQRYSTNTFPVWPLAQPFRTLGHNGEINTLLGNTNWMRARERELESEVWGEQVEALRPVIQEGGSDSAALDNVFELLVVSGRDPLHAMMMLLPDAYESRNDLDPDLTAFYEFQSCLMEPWDGPAAVVFSDGRYAAAALDRNGLRPQRYWVTEDGLVITGSEAGVVPQPEERIVEKGRLGPGQMIAVDTLEKRLLKDATIKQQLSRRRPYRQWIDNHMVRAPRMPMAETEVRSETELTIWQRLFGYGKESLTTVLAPMMKTGKVPIGSMGDDTPLAALSAKPQKLYRYFRQRFAQVTNPPIDPLRERTAMSLTIAAGPWGSLLEEREESARLIEFASPILGPGELSWLEETGAPAQGYETRRLDVSFPVSEGPAALEGSLEELCRAGERAVDQGASLLVLTDRDCGPDRAPIPMLLAVSALHHSLTEARKRMRATIICDTAEAREDHQFACLIGFGATLVYPYLAYETVQHLVQKGEAGDIDPATALSNYRAAIEMGLLKIMSKMGIGPVASYQGAQIFEAIGLDQELVDRYFRGTASRIGGIGLEEIARDGLAFHQEVFGAQTADGPDRRGSLELLDEGIYRFRKDGEYHALNPLVFKALHKAVRTESREAFESYAALVDERPPCSLRDLLDWRSMGPALELTEVEPASDIAKRFVTQAMSHGAISSEAHETLAVAMNRLGAKSNSGEGGEARSRFKPFVHDQEERGFAPWKPARGDWANSRIKQVASGRFGVTPEYLVSADELEIKMAQGAKPGEGGQIPGHKVSHEIASIRRSVPGVTLISPPPHHDIYSIEDLAQLIYDLKRVNPRARVGVKLVSGAGVGTVAAGVAKGYADTIMIAGHDGGTGASPVGSIKHAGLPWEVGLAECQQVLIHNDLRERVKLRVDGGIKTGRDVVMAALLGADEFGFGTVALVALGCIMARQCHLNTCPVGIATQREELRSKYPGRPEQVISFMLFVAEQVRHILAQMGVSRLEEVIGRTELLKVKSGRLAKGTRLDLEDLIYTADPSSVRARRQLWERNDRSGARQTLDERVWKDCHAVIGSGARLRQHYEINNRDRSVGARLSGEIAWHTGDVGLEPGALDLHFRGTAGQSFGAFCNRGMRLTLTGEVQDYVGKSMYGGEIVIKPPPESRFEAHRNTILGNTALYGATGGSLFAAGRAGERLCVRNSGARAVVEGCGDHGCEYMTNGVAVVLGETGRNFAAGMSGGVAYVLDLEHRLETRLNPAMASIEPLRDETDLALLRTLLERHCDLTDSTRANWVLERWDSCLEDFRRVVAHPGLEEEGERDQESSGLKMAAIDAVLAEKRASGSSAT